MKTYHGKRGRDGVKVRVVDELDQTGYKLKPRNDLRNHSPDGFEYGYGGSGPAQLALALLADVFDDYTALNFYQQFKREEIATLDQREDFTLTEVEIKKWLAAELAVRH